jgi:hypothetical protein
MNITPKRTKIADRQGAKAQNPPLLEQHTCLAQKGANSSYATYIKTPMDMRIIDNAT